MERPITELTGNKVEMLGKGGEVSKMVDVNLTPSFERAGYYFERPDNVIPTPTNPVSGTDSIRNGIADVKNEASDLVNNMKYQDNLGTSADYYGKIMKATSMTADPAYNDALSVIKDLEDKVSKGFISGADGDIINAAGDMAAAEYTPIIGEAIAQKEAGMPKATIAAGERGGFMNTQFAGAAALAPTKGGTFEGAGGELENIKSAYDKTISMLKVKQTQARDAAVNAARQAALDGTQQDLAFAREMLQEAKDAWAAEQEMNERKLATITNWEKSQEAKLAKQTDTALQAVMANLPEGDDTNIDNLITMYARQYGVDENVLKNAVKSYQAEQQQALFERGKEIFNIAKGLEEDQSYTMPDGTVITGTKKVDEGLETKFETAGGQRMMITYDKKGNIINQKSLGSAYKDGGSGGGVSNEDKSRYRSIFSELIGSDGFVSPDDYKEARVVWIEEGKDPALFDKEFVGFRNPNNKQYGVEEIKSKFPLDVFSN